MSHDAVDRTTAGEALARLKEGSARFMFSTGAVRLVGGPALGPRLA
jgi:hypothetical protein